MYNMATMKQHLHSSIKTSFIQKKIDKKLKNSLPVEYPSHRSMMYCSIIAVSIVLYQLYDAPTSLPPVRIFMALSIKLLYDIDDEDESIAMLLSIKLLYFTVIDLSL